MVKVFNILGQIVDVLVNEELSAGIYTVDFNAEGLTSGVYFYTMLSGDYTETKKMLLIKTKAQLRLCFYPNQGARQ